MKNEERAVCRRLYSMMKKDLSPWRWSEEKDAYIAEIKGLKLAIKNVNHGTSDKPEFHPRLLIEDSDGSTIIEGKYNDLVKKIYVYISIHYQDYNEQRIKRQVAMQHKRLLTKLSKIIQ